MKAIVYSEFGPPDVLKLAEIDKPLPKPKEVLVRVRAASANPLDWHFIRGEPRAMRLMGKPNNRVPGADFAGQVEAVGADVTQFRVGDEVFGGCNGAFAEYACANSDNLARKPRALSFEQAAAIPVAGCTALMAVRDKGGLRPGQSVLVNGAAGGVGTFAVQIAKALGANVTGVCSARNRDLVRSLGADRVIDYAAEDFAASGRQYDLVVRVAGNRSLKDHRRVLTPDGTLVLVGGGVGRDMGGRSQTLDTLGVLALVLGRGIIARFLRQRIRVFVAKMRPSDLTYLGELCETGKVTPVIERSYALADAAEAIRHIEAGHARGKVVVTT
ncbi:MAG TPA: NAD(P)-dependent alcohol dehydrogenase [Gammaproteobacteria bacterium]|nr:NAD(P)-dependent alcohol dehydrogenase [Gammaproteobacteria bacterium]